MTVVCGFIRILWQFKHFGIMAGSHNVPHVVQYTPNTESYVLNGILDHKNIWFDTSITSLCGLVRILGRLTHFGIMAASDRARNP